MKVKLPFYARSFHGMFDQLLFQTTHRTTYLRVHNPGDDPETPAQVAQRAAFKCPLTLWNSLDSVGQTYLTDQAFDKPLNAQADFVRLNAQLLANDLPPIIFPDRDDLTPPLNLYVVNEYAGEKIRIGWADNIPAGATHHYGVMTHKGSCAAIQVKNNINIAYNAYTFQPTTAGQTYYIFVAYRSSAAGWIGTPGFIEWTFGA